MSQLSERRRRLEPRIGEEMPVAGFKFLKSSRLVAGLAVAASAALGIGLGGGAADAAPLQQITTTGYDLGTFGDHDYCHGAVRATLTSPRRGVVNVKLTSHGFVGNGPGWAKNPRCNVLFIVIPASYRETHIPASFGRRPGETVSRDIVTGSGVNVFSIGAFAKNTAVRAPSGSEVAVWMLVP